MAGLYVGGSSGSNSNVSSIPGAGPSWRPYEWTQPEDPIPAPPPPPPPPPQPAPAPAPITVGSPSPSPPPSPAMQGLSSVASGEGFREGFMREGWGEEGAPDLSVPGQRSLPASSRALTTMANGRGRVY